MILQTRDLNILRFIIRYKYVFSEHIQKAFFFEKSRTAMYRILTRLENHKLIQRLYIPRSPNLSLGNLIYATDRAANLLCNEFNLNEETLGYKKVQTAPRSINHIYHRYRLISFLIQLDEDVSSLPISIKSFGTDTERVRKSGIKVAATHISTADKSISLIPDIFFVLKGKLEKEALFFVEIDTGKEIIGGQFENVKVNSLLYKFQSYEKILADGFWKTQISTSATAFEVLTITEKDQHVEGIIQQCRNKLQWKHLFLFNTYKHIDRDGVLISRWVSLKGAEWGRSLL